MPVSSAKLPLSSVYLNLLQARPVSPASPVNRVNAPVAPAQSHAPAPTPASPSAAPTGGNPPRNQLRGQIINILA